MAACGYERKFRGVGQHFRFAPKTGNSLIDVRIHPDFVRFTPRSRPSWWWRRRSACDPERKSAVLEEAEHWSLITLREKLVKIGAKVVSHGRYVTFQLAEVAVPRELFRKILRLIDDLRPRPAPA